MTAASGLALEPPRLAFRGAKRGESRRQRFSVVNTAPLAQRVHLILSPSDCFGLECAKAGLLAPGMRQEAAVLFTAQRDEAASATVRVVGETGELLLRVEALPGEAACLAFPPHIALPFRGVGLRVSSAASLENAGCVAVDFEIRLLDEGAGITLHPRLGRIAPQETLKIEFSATPQCKDFRPARGQVLLDGTDFEPLHFEVRFLPTWRPSAARHRAVPKTAATGGTSEGAAPVQLPLPTHIASAVPDEAEASSTPLGEFGAEYARIQELSKLKSIKLTRQLGAEQTEDGTTAELLEKTLANCEEIRRRRILAELMAEAAPSAAFPELFPEDVLVSPRKKPSFENVMRAKLQRRKAFEEAIKKVIVRGRLQKALHALRRFWAQKREAAAFHRPFLSAPPCGTADLPAFEARPQWRLPAPAPPALLEEKRRSEAEAPAGELITLDDQTRLDPVLDCAFENNAYAAMSPFDDYLFVPRVAERAEAQGAEGEDLFFAEPKPRWGDESRLEACLGALPAVEIADIVAEVHLKEALARLRGPGGAVAGESEGAFEWALSQPPAAHADPLLAERMPKTPSARFVGEFKAKANGWAGLFAFSALTTERSERPLQPKSSPYDIFYIKNVDEHCPRHIAHRGKDDEQDSPSSDAEEASPLQPFTAPATACAALDRAGGQRDALSAAVEGYKRARVGVLQTLKADVNEYVVDPANRVRL